MRIEITSSDTIREGMSIILSDLVSVIRYKIHGPDKQNSDYSTCNSKSNSMTLIFMHNNYDSFT
jgi:hypothetical protein